MQGQRERTKWFRSALGPPYQGSQGSQHEGSLWNLLFDFIHCPDPTSTSPPAWCSPVSQWEAHLSAVVPGMHHCAAPCQLGGWLLPSAAMEAGSGGCSQARRWCQGSKGGPVTLAGFAKSWNGICLCLPVCATGVCTKKIHLFRLSWEFCHFPMRDYKIV